MDKFTFSVGLVNAILQYLDTKPHGETRRLIDAIQQEAQANAVPQPPIPPVPESKEEPKPE